MEPSERRRKALEELGILEEHKRVHRRTRPVSSFKMSVSDERGGRTKYFSCRRKKRYATHSEATRKAKRAGMKRGVKLRVYFCNFCGGFHLTKQPKLT